MAPPLELVLSLRVTCPREYVSRETPLNPLTRLERLGVDGVAVRDSVGRLNSQSVTFVESCDFSVAADLRNEAVIDGAGPVLPGADLTGGSAMLIAGASLSRDVGVRVQVAGRAARCTPSSSL